MTDLQQPPTPAPPMSPQEARAQAKAAKAYAKAQRPWVLRHKFSTGLAGLIVLIVIINVASSGGGAKKTAPTSTGATNTTGTTKAAYPDAQKEDHVAQPGGSVQLSGYTATASALSRMSDSIGGKNIVATVTLVNRDSTSQAYNMFDWKLQTPAGQVLDATISLTDGQLDSGDLVANGTVTGKVVFDDKGETGQFVLIYKPDTFNATRGIWLNTM